MNTNFTKLKMQDAIKTIQNNDLCTLTLCNNGSPFCTPIIYDSDCYCGNIKLTFETCIDGKLSELIENDNNCCCQLTNRCNNKIEVITMEGTCEILPNESTCPCLHEESCFVTVEFTPCKITGRCYCNQRRRNTPCCNN